MNPINRDHIPLPKLRDLFNATYGDIYGDDTLSAIDISLNSPNSHFKLLHHILIASYSKVTLHHRETRIPLIGLDIETNYKTGEPRLLGYSYRDGYYQADINPTLNSLYLAVKGIMENRESGTALDTWGNLDINCLIRLFNPDETEKTYISKGFSGKFNYRKSDFDPAPPCIREMPDGGMFSIDHYIGGRSMRLGVLDGGRYKTIWIYNLSQFFPTRIADTAKSLEFDWKDFSEDTHLIDWDRFGSDPEFRKEVLESNKQDAQTVRLMADHLQDVFYQAFNAYPSLLVSAGSLADAAVSKMLNREDYESNSWQYLKYNTWGVDNPHIRLAESLISEAYSAGYVDQFRIGYSEEAFTADISSAYPHKIRQLPDLRECELVSGSGNARESIQKLEDSGYEIFTIVFRGLVTIPEYLEYHPITVKTPKKQNIRPIGTFRASYYLEERRFCKSHGATFDNEQWVIFALKKRKTGAIAQVSKALASLRDDYQARLRKAKETGSDSEIIFYDALQNMVKVVDNSLYGKNVMATEVLATVNGKLEQVGLKAGDRYNQLYGGWITALTRIQIAEACMAIQDKGSKPIMAMTDAVYWEGKPEHMPSEMISFHGKEAGYFEPVETVHKMFTVKTGQYEYAKPERKSPTGWHFYHKMRGLNLPFEERNDSESFYHKLISEWISDKSIYMHADEVLIPVPTRKLVTIGMPDLEYLGMVADGVAELKPFIMSGKQVERYLTDYRTTLKRTVRLQPAIAQFNPDADSPLEFLSGLLEQGGNYITKHERKRMFYNLIVKVTDGKMRFGNRFDGRMPLEKRRLAECSFGELEEWTGIKRDWAKI